VRGDQILSIWLALATVTIESSGVEYIKGSPPLGREFRPIHFGGDTEAYKMLPARRCPTSMRAQGSNSGLDSSTGTCSPATVCCTLQTVHGRRATRAAPRRRRA